jgi:hypothetical protein
MKRPLPNQASFDGGTGQRWRRRNPTVFALFLILLAPVTPVAAQTSGAPVTPATAPTTGGGTELFAPPTPAVPAPSPGPEILPPLPGGGFGVPNRVLPPNAVAPALAPAPSPPSLRLPPAGKCDVTPLQQSQPGAPALLIQPSASLGETVTDNARNTSTDRVTDLETQILPGVSISADTPRIQGVLTGNLEYDKYIVATNEDQLFGNLYGSGCATAVADHLFLDAKSVISQTAQFGAAGFTPVSQLPKSQVTQYFSNYLSPYFRESYGGLLDTELRYSFTSTNFGGANAALQETVPGVPSTAALSNSTSNDGRLIVATGSDFERLISRFTLDASNLNASSGSVIPNTQVSAYDDVEYRINPAVAALARLGYENIQYPFVPAATTAGVLWQVGGRLALGPDNQYLILRYGEQQGVYGVNGSLRYEITPTTVLTAAAVQGIGSQQSQLGSNLAGSSLDAYGRLVDQYDLPTALVNPEFSLQNNVYRYYVYGAGITSKLGVNTFSLFGYYNRQISLVISEPTTTSVGANLGWTRTIRPDLSTNASIGFANVTNQTVFTAAPSPSATTVPSQNTVSASLALSYLFAKTLTGSIEYSLYFQTNGVTSTTAATGNVVTNRLLFLLTKTF